MINFNDVEIHETKTYITFTLLDREWAWDIAEFFYTAGYPCCVNPNNSLIKVIVQKDSFQSY